MKKIKIQHKKWTVLFGGTGREKIILALLKKKINIDRIIVPKNSSKKLLSSINNIKLNFKIKIIKSNKDDLNFLLKNNYNGVLLSIGFPYKINQSILNYYYMAINIHPTLLPKYKGPTSGAYIIINKEKYSGSTVHLMNKDIDSGKIIAQKRFKLSFLDTIRSVQYKTYLLEPNLILSAINNINNNKKFKRNYSLNNIVYKRKPSDSRIDPKKSLLELYDYIRACDPDSYPSFFYIKNKKIFIKMSTSKNFNRKKNFSL